VASTSLSQARVEATKTIMKNMCEHSSTLLDQTLLVAKELVRVSILWPELWHETLEEASRLYFREHNITAMFERLQPLHESTKKYVQTITVFCRTDKHLPTMTRIELEQATPYLFQARNLEIAFREHTSPTDLLRALPIFILKSKSSIVNKDPADSHSTEQTASTGIFC